MTTRIQSMTDSTYGAPARGDSVVSRLRRIGRSLKWVDLAGMLLVMIAALAGYLLVMMLIDHWVVGLSVPIRLVGLLGLSAAGAYYALARVIPLLVRRIHPLYAARAVEHHQPALKNSLVNFLLLRQSPEGVHRAILEGVENQATRSMTGIAAEEAVDYGSIVRTGYGLATILIVLLVYQLFSPKDPLTSFARLIAPWKDIARPTRVHIEPLEPVADVQVYRGATLTVRVRAYGLHDDEPIEMIYSAVDGEFTNRVLRMEATGERWQYQSVLDPDGQGIQQDLEFWYRAGDAARRPHRVRVVDVPTMDIERVVYHFPRYTGLADEIRTDGTIRALEGTRASIYASSNHAIDEAYIQLLEQRPVHGQLALRNGKVLPMRADERQAVGTMLLELDAQRRAARFPAYQLKYLDQDGGRNQRPVTFQVEVFPDVAPDVEWVKPRGEEMEAAVNADIPIEVRAVDPDFQLAELWLHAGIGGQQGPRSQQLLQQPHTGQYLRRIGVVPEKLGGRAGDVLFLWWEARDNRTAPGSDRPEPNVTRSRPLRIRLVPAADSGSKSGSGDTARQEEGQPTAGEDAPNDQRQPSGGPQEQRPDGSSPAQPPDQGQDSGRASGTEGSPPTESGRQGDDHADQQQESGEHGDQQNDHQADAHDQQPGGTSGGAEGEANREGGVGQPDASQSGRPPEATAGTDSGSGQQPSEPDSQQPPGSGNGNPARDPRRNDAGGGASGTSDPLSPHQPTPEEGPEERDSPVVGDGGTDRQEVGRDSEDRSGSGESSGGERGASAPPSAPTEERRLERAHRDGSADERRRSPEPARPVANDGSEDFEAFDRILDRLRERGDAQPGDTRSGESSENPSQQPPRVHEERPSGGDDRPSAADGARQPKSDRRSTEPGSALQKPPDQGPDSAGDASSSTAEPGGSRSPADPPPSDPQDASGSKDGSGGTPADGQSMPPGSSGETSSGRPGETERRPPDADGPLSSASPTRSPSGTGTISGGGRPGSAASDEQPLSDDHTGREKANLEYARRATNLVLEHLQDQAEEPDAELLEELGWSRDDLQQFLRRWQQLHQGAAQPGDAGEQARRELDQRLRSLGLTPPGTQLRSADVQRREPGGMAEQGARSRPPQRYLDRYRLYRKSINRE